MDDERKPPSGRAVWAVAAMVASLAPALFLWDFTVDDALIPVRYARHVALGEGYRFNLGGPSTDGVTPLPWPFLLVPFAHADALTVLFRAKCINLLAGLAGAAVLGSAIARARSPLGVKVAAVLLLALLLPVAAHSVSGLETGLVIALATAASVRTEHPRSSALLAGLAAAFRPEMLPWALVLSVGAAARGDGGRAKTVRLTVTAIAAAGPFLACVFLRLVFFGRAAPLSLMAKPSDLAHGLAYAGAASLLCVSPLAALAPVAVWRAPRAAGVVGLAALVHFAAVAFAGGDWMPYARLVAPIAPSLLYVFVVAAPHAHRALTVLRAAASVAVGVTFMWHSAAGRHVGRDRQELVRLARPTLEHARAVASLDIGWPSAATEGEIIDLAGLTDPEIAALPGGHTSKRVDVPLLLARRPEYVLVFVDGRAEDWRDSLFTRVVEARFASSDLFARHFTEAAFFPLTDHGTGYFLLRNQPP